MPGYRKTSCCKLYVLNKNTETHSFKQETCQWQEYQFKMPNFRQQKFRDGCLKISQVLLYLICSKIFLFATFDHYSKLKVQFNSTVNKYNSL